jgi:hypothetical protein
MFILAHNDPIWITIGMAVGIVIGLMIAARASVQNRK